ncbi:serine/threonine-protein kinase [Nocardia callitridis]|uniref:non-specific serine/threonine protein kinase n=1 Tax=Nocardia callitridis TaxID=648753 RepID=A0ABP9KNE9_9NOCA
MLNNGAVFAGFTIERLLGQGGMGSVYLARHPRLPRQTALKLLNRDLFTDNEVRARFEREADLAAQLDHPSIVAVYDRGTEDDQLWISLQFVEGEDASAVQPLSLPTERAVQIIEGVASALDYAHGMGVLHRDVKPANFMLARAGGGLGERVFLTDFGIARLREDSTHLTQTGMFTATLAYASPEQMTGAHLDHRSDQYSLACSLYWLLTGVGPFDAPAPSDIIRGHLQLPPPSVSARRQGLSPAMDPVLAKAMAKRPDDRFASCVEFAAAARQALTAPAPPPPAYSSQAAPTMIAPGSTQGGAQSTGAAQLSGGGYGTAPDSGFAQQQFTPAPQQQFTPQQQFAPSQYSSPQQQYSQQQFNTAQPQQFSQGQPYPSTGYGQPNQHVAQQQFAQQPGYPSNFGPGYGAPPPRRGNSNTALIVSLILVAVLVIAGGVFAIVKLTGDDSSGGQGTETQAVQNPSDPETLTKAFPRLLPQTADLSYGYGSGDGFDGKSCFMSVSENKTDKKLTSVHEVPTFANWVTAWDCFGGAGHNPDYLVVGFNSPQEAQAATAALPTNTKGTETNGATSHTTYRWQENKSSYPDAYLVADFADEPARASYLLFASARIDEDDSYRIGITPAEFKSWFTTVPL